MSDSAAMWLALSVIIASFAGCTAADNFKPRSSFMETCAQQRLVCAVTGLGREKIIGPIPEKASP